MIVDIQGLKYSLTKLTDFVDEALSFHNGDSLRDKLDERLIELRHHLEKNNFVLNNLDWVRSIDAFPIEFVKLVKAIKIDISAFERPFKIEHLQSDLLNSDVRWSINMRHDQYIDFLQSELCIEIFSDNTESVIQNVFDKINQLLSLRVSPRKVTVCFKQSDF